MPNLLLDEQPLVIQPTLARILGLNEAIVVQQIHYWLEANKKANKNYYSGRYWTYNSIVEWQIVFSFWSIDTVKRTFRNLENLNILLSKNLNADKRDRTKWYTINYEKLDQFAKCIGAKCPNGKVQNAPTQEGKMPQPLPDTTTEITTDIKTIPPISPKGDDASVNPETGLSGESLLVETATETRISDDTPSGPTPSMTRKNRKKTELTVEQQKTFAQFWAIWPHKVSRGQAEITWGKLNPTDGLLADILAGVERSKKHDRRFRPGSSYVPHPSTWLNDKGWLDEFNTRSDIAYAKQSPFTGKQYGTTL